ncbi:hypothetical protein LCGC14_1743970 [marine sediment metagenome]|uniref:Uncharacterized protein n=1 Tax=marine sediment metagenome TaxID=412755 RepID=A0A0F9K5D3_9ZZZZ
MTCSPSWDGSTGDSFTWNVGTTKEFLEVRNGVDMSRSQNGAGAAGDQNDIPESTWRWIMKVSVNEEYLIVLREIFNPIVISSPSGDFGICQRDGGIEIVKNGKIIFSSAVDHGKSNPPRRTEKGNDDQTQASQA